MTLYALTRVRKKSVESQTCLTKTPKRCGTLNVFCYIFRQNEREYDSPKLVGPYPDHTPEWDQNRYDIGNNKLQWR